MKFKKSIFCIFFYFFLIFILNAQDTKSGPSILKGKELSDFVRSELLNNKIEFFSIPLCLSENNDFPYNIHININASEKTERTYDTIIFVFNQENASQNIPFLVEFISWCKNQVFDFDINIVLTACDKSPIEGNDSMTGSSIYADLLQGGTSRFVIYSNLDAQKLTTITPGSAKQVSPLWLVDLIDTSLKKNKINPTIKGSFYLSLYKLNILRSSRILSSFLTRNIPAVEINLKESEINKELLFSIYQDVILSFSGKTDFKDDTHYIPLNLFGKRFWITEYFTIIMLLISITFSLISVCDLGFIFRKNHSKKTLLIKRGLKNLYLVPSIIFVITISLEISQFIARLLFSSVFRNPLIALGIKVIFTLIFISLFYFLLLKIRKFNNYSTYDFLLQFTAILNIFVFSAIDISLFYLFAIIYVIAYISVHVKNSVVTYALFLISLFPYIHLIYIISLYSTMQQIMPLIFAHPLYNLLLSCAFAPLSIFLFKLFFHFKKKFSKKALELNATNKIAENLVIEKKDDQKDYIAKLNKHIQKLIPRSYAIILTTTVVIFILAFFVVSKIIQNNLTKRIEPNDFFAQVIESNQNYFLKASCNDSNYYGGKFRHINIETSSIQSPRIQVFVSAQTDNPIHYTMFNFSQSENDNQIQFNLSDFPPQKFAITYTPDNSENSVITIYGFFDADLYPEDFIKVERRSRRKTYVKEKLTLLILPEDAREEQK